MNSIIYGHHMEKDAMFGEVEYYQEPSYFKKHAHGKLYYGGKWHEVEFLLSFMPMLMTAFYIIRMQQKETDTLMYLDYVRQNASYFEELSFQMSERFVTLSTCTSDSTNGRHLLVGRIQEEIKRNRGDLQYEKKINRYLFSLYCSVFCVFPVKQAFAAAGMTEVPLTVKQKFLWWKILLRKWILQEIMNFVL